MRKINFLAVLLGGIMSAQTTFTLIKDINPGILNSAPSNFTLYNGKMYFGAISYVNGLSIGNELWESDGTESGTKLVSDIVPGTSSSSPSNLFTFNNKIYFSGSSSINGANVAGLLLSYDDLDGVQIVSSTSKYSTNFTKAGSTLYFKATNTSINPNTQRLFYLDSSGQSVMAEDTVNLSILGYVGNQLLANAQFANATNPSWTQLFGFNGTSYDVIKNINPSGMSYPQNFYYSAALGKTFFSANGGNGAEPWMTDGTETGTSIVKDINTFNATAGSGPSNFAEYKGKVYFSASNGLENGAELWVTDGTEPGTKMLKDIIPGTTGSFPEKMMVHKNKLYFLLTNTGNVRQLWESDGTESGTKLLSSVASASSLISYNDNLYMVGRVGSNDLIGIELYKVNLSDDILSSLDVSNTKISIYPNPSKGEVNVTKIQSGSFELYDVAGKLVKTGAFSNNKIFTGNLTGNYILKIRSQDNKTTSTTKIMIQ